MDNFNLYKDISARTGGEIYIGVVGPVRTGKSTFIRRFMELMVLPGLEKAEKNELRDQTPVSGSGKIITTVEPKFIPKNATALKLSDDVAVNVRLIDCVGYMVDGASGHEENNAERMVKTPWFDHEIPFTQAAEIGTHKVINDHSTIGIVITCDDSFGEIPREKYLAPEEKTIQELKKIGKPFVVLVNSEKPFAEETLRIVEAIQEKYGVTAIPVNCKQLRKDDIHHILESILYEFPISQVEFFVPKWVEMLSADHKIKQELLEKVKDIIKKLSVIKDVTVQNVQIESTYVKKLKIDKIDMSSGCVKINLDIDEVYYYEMISSLTGVTITGEYQLLSTIRELSKMKQEYAKVQDAIQDVRVKGYGVVTPEQTEIQLAEPEVIRHGNKFGVKIKSEAPSIHMIRANIETEIAPIVGNEEQAKDLITYIKNNASEEEGIWQTTIFGKSIEQLVDDGIRNKLSQIGEESQIKLQETMQKIVNESSGGMVCIII